MEKLDAYKCRSEFFTVYSVDMNYVIRHIEELPFNSILYDPSVEIEEGLLEFTNEEHPISMGYDYVYKNYLGFYGKYYDDNKKEIDKYLLEVGKKISTIYLLVDKRIINDKLRKVLIDNKNIKTLIIGDELIRKE